jgi:hypothetical protein
MNTAIIYTGAMRSFEKCMENQRWHVLRHFPASTFYIVTEKDEDAHKANLLKDKYPGVVEVRFVKQPEMVIPAGCPDEWTPGKPYMHEPYHISVDPRHVLGQLWMLREGWRLYEEANDPADLIIRIRPDLWFHSFEKPVWLRSGPKLMSAGLEWLASVPWWGRFGGCNDRFALLGAHAAKAYFTAYDHLPTMIAEGAPLHPETLIHYAMKRSGISICDDMKAEFSTLRKSGEMRPPEITSIDIAHFKA